MLKLPLPIDHERNYRGDVAVEPQTINIREDPEGYFYYRRLYKAISGPLGSQDEVVRYLDRFTSV